MDGARHPVVELQTVKDYLRVDGDADDRLILGLIEAAGGYLSNAGVAPPAAGARRALYELAVCALCLTWYEKREAVITGTIVAENPALRRIIVQLKLTEPVRGAEDAGGGAVP